MKRRYFIYLLLFALIFINFVDRITLSIAGKAISEELGLSPVQLGYLFSSFLWSYILCLIPAGILTDRWGARTMAAICISVWSAAQMLTGAASSLGVMILTRLGLGIGECPTNSAASRALRDWAPASERGAAMAVFISGSFIGPAVGAALVGWLIALVGWRLCFVITGGIGFVWLAAWLVWFRKPEQATFLSEDERAMILREREVDSAAATGRSDSVLTLLSSRSMWGVALTQGGLGYNIYLFLSWMPNYLEKAKGLNVRDTGFYTAIAFGVAGVVSIVLSRLIDRSMSLEDVRSGRRRIAVCGCLILAASVLLIPWLSSLAAIVALIAFSLTFTATGIAMNFTLTNDLTVLPDNVGKSFGLLNMGANGFGVMAPIVTGYVIQWTGLFDGSFYISGGLLLMGSIITLVMTHGPIGVREADASGLAVGSRA